MATITTGTSTSINEYLRRSLFSRNTENKNVLEYLKNAESVLGDLLERSVCQGEGNSVVITGPNGSGKSWVMKRVLKSLESNSKTRNNFILVTLNGVIHSDDRKALLEIARQFNLASQFEEKINMSFAGTLSHMIQVIRSGHKRNKCVIFVLEEFHLFASHKNQTLLYNLFDLSQSPYSPVAVVGVTCFLNFLELLEKRVKSRFSHRVIHVFPTTSFEEYISLFQSLLTVPATLDCSKHWNDHIMSLSSDDSILSVLKQVYNHSADIQTLKHLLGSAVSLLPDNDDDNVSSLSLLSGRILRESLSLCSFHNDPKVTLIQDLSVLELSLLIACKHVLQLNNGEPVNFEMLFDEYLKFASRHSHTTESLSKPIMFKVFEKLVSLDFLCPVSEGRSIMREYVLVRLSLEDYQLIEGVKKYKNCPTYLRVWAETKPTT